MDVKASEVVDELKPYWEHIMKIENNPNSTSKDKEEKLGQVLKQIVQVLNKYPLK